jgi:hypothetical protein
MGVQVKRREKSPVELYEEAVYLVRSAPGSVLAAYYLGALPFLLGLLFFWADMTQNAVAYEHCAPASLAVALLFGWMLYCQTVFMRSLHSELSGAPAVPWFSPAMRKFAWMQITLQPSKFLVLLAAALTILPFAGAYSFYPNLMAVDDDECVTIRRAIRAARKHANFWQGQNWVLLAILILLNVMIFLNVGTAILLLPQILKVFLGIETELARSGMSALNTTFFAVTAGLTYLITNPVTKAVYLLRYFYADSRETGEDLQAAYQAASQTDGDDHFSTRIELVGPGLPPCSRASARLRLAIFALLFLIPIPAQTSPVKNQVTPTELNQAIDQVIHRPEFTWRMPRPPHPPATSSNWFVQATESFLKAMGRAGRQLVHWVDQLMQWIGDKLKQLIPGLGGNSPAADSRKLRALIYTLLAGVALVLAWLLWQVLRNKKKRATTEATAVALTAIELNNPDLQADQQPLDEWLLLARDCIARQEFRLALRAFYLAGLKYLAERSLISIQRGKSNHDYDRELRRKARDKAELLAAFQQNLGVFEKTWYGMYDVDRSIVEQFESTLARMRSYATTQ